MILLHLTVFLLSICWELLEDSHKLAMAVYAIVVANQL